MNKNLKKVISAVAALALSASSFVAMAANYPDVDASASYKQAVDELSALKVIEGYEDGTFQPDKLVTRAEFSKMIITALGSAELAQAKAAEGRDTAFTDVKGEHWAAGYVTAAVSQSIINGMGDGTFAPESNITYAQAMKMLVCAAGYEQWSMDKGGWPDGYMYWGNQLKVGNGVKDVVDSTEITRAQCAQMIDNLLTAPVCVDTHDYSYDQYGNKYPKLEAKDGYGVGYQSILIKNHDAYKVKGTVTDTHRSGDVNADEVKFTIQNARNWLDQEDQISKSKENSEDITLKVGESDIDDYLKQYVEVIVQETEDDEYVALSVVLAGQSEEVVLEADDFDNENSAYKSDSYTDVGRLYFYSNGKTTNYKIDENVELYVNGVKVEDVNKGIDDYVVDNDASKITLVDTPSDDSNSTDGYYDLILVDYYGTIIVDSVDDVDTDEPIINTKADDLDGLGTWNIDLTNDDVTYTFVKDNAVITVADLQPYDVLSVKFDVVDFYENNVKFDDLKFYDVTVSSATDTGKYSTYSKDDDEYVINGTTYTVNSDIVSPLDSSTTYVLYIDAFGRVAYTEEEDSVQKLAILDSVYDAEGGSVYYAKLIYADGSSDTKTLKETSTDSGLSKEVTAAMEIVYKNGTAGGEKKPVQDRVIKYSINASDELTVKENVGYYKTSAGTSAAIGEYKLSSERIGSAKISLDSTAFLNIYDVKDIKAMSVGTLTDGNEYTAYAFDKSSSDSIYRLVLVASGTGEITSSTKVAVYNTYFNTTDDLDNEVDALEVFINGEKTTVNCESSVSAASFGLERGDAILMETNESGEVISVENLTKDIDLTDTDTIWNAALTNSAALVDNTFVAGLSGKESADLFFGAITGGTSGRTLELSDIVNGESDTNAAESISFDSDCNVYVVDYNEQAKNRISVGTTSNAQKTNITNNAYDDDKIMVTWSKNGSNQNPKLALVRTYDGDAMDVVVYLPKK